MVFATLKFILNIWKNFEIVNKVQHVETIVFDRWIEFSPEYQSLI